MPLNIAIFGGAFNPPHQGHLLVARNALRVASLDRVLFVPSAVPPHKDDGSLAPGPDRLEMVRLAIDGDPRMEVLPIEIERGGISYSVDTALQAQRERPTDRLFFIMGSDNFRDVGNWHRAGELMDLCEFLVVERPGCPVVFPPPSLPSSQLARLRYRLCDGPRLDVASSEVRRLLAKGGDVSGLLPPAVHRYILSRSLYQTP